MSAASASATDGTMRYNRYLQLALAALVVFVLYIILNLLGPNSIEQLLAEMLAKMTSSQGWSDFLGLELNWVPLFK